MKPTTFLVVSAFSAFFIPRPAGSAVWLRLFLMLALLAPGSAVNSLSAEEPKTLHGLPLLFSEDFENGHDRWEATDDKTWTHRKVNGSNHVFGINARKNSYKPAHRSPYHIALVKNLALADFVITFRVRSTNDTGGHRDCCVFFSHQDPANFWEHLHHSRAAARLAILLDDEACRTAIIGNITEMRRNEVSGQNSRRPKGCGPFRPQLRSSLVTFFFQYDPRERLAG